MRGLILLWAFLSAAPVFAEKPDVIRGPGDTQYHTGFLHKEQEKRQFGNLNFVPKQKLVSLIPDEYDSRTENVVPDIRNQGSCGSCWAFAMTKSFESALLQSGRSLDLAEQDWLVNDSSAYGCSGGFMNGTYAVEKGQALEADCPYKANDSYTCRAVKAAKASRWAFVGARGRAPTNEELKLAIMQYKVVTVTVAAGLGFSNVGDDGVINSCASRTINHMVNIVGWHSDGRFILANSWGKGWGQGGYGFIAQGCNRLASTVDSALVIVAETGPAPQPPRAQLPSEVHVQKGIEVMLGVRSETGVTYKWSNGETGSMIYVNPLEETIYTLTAVGPNGTTESAVKVVPE